MTLIIAEAGVNHNGNEALAFALVDAAIDAGADIVKFQTFKAKNLVTKSAKQAEYQINNTQKEESQFAMLSRLELNFAAHHKLLAYCQQRGIEFLSTAFDQESLDFLTQELKLNRLKISSGELTNAPLLLEHARANVDLIVSTGMATLAEIQAALGVLAFGYTAQMDCTPSIDAFAAAFNSPAGQAALAKRVTLLHCTTEYPAPFAEINLRAMQTMADMFSLPVGYSDHSQGITIPIAAVAMGAKVIEKHFTLDKNLPGPDHKASLAPDELKAMIIAIRQVEQALGDGVKTPQASELKNILVARKSIIANTSIENGEAFTPENISVKRPGTGMTPFLYWQLIAQQKASKQYNEGDNILE